MRKIDEEKIKRQAKEIMDDFVRSLDKIGGIKEAFGAERKVSVRTPKKSEFSDFKERALKNAPKRKGNYFVMEKKNW
jgi:Asp-tRNA(Asn)/Glu-tRNA(Gln) amidotransferase C subunit